jgi:hypothetical protein
MRCGCFGLIKSRPRFQVGAILLQVSGASALLAAFCCGQQGGNWLALKTAYFQRLLLALVLIVSAAIYFIALGRLA